MIALKPSRSAGPRSRSDDGVVGASRTYVDSSTWDPITVGRPSVAGVVPSVGFEVDVVLALAAAAVRESSYPMAGAIVDHAVARHVTWIDARDFEAVAGHGVRARFGSHRILVGTPAFLDAAGIQIGDLDAEAARLAGEGKRPVFVGYDSRVAGIIFMTESVTSD